MEIKIMSTENPDIISIRFDSKDFDKCFVFYEGEEPEYMAVIKGINEPDAIIMDKEQYISLNKQLDIARGGVVKGNGIVSSEANKRLNTEINYLFQKAGEKLNFITAEAKSLNEMFK